MCVCVCVRLCVRACVRAYVRACLRACVLACMCVLCEMHDGSKQIVRLGGVVLKISKSKSRESGFKFSCLTEYLAIDSVRYVNE